MENAIFRQLVTENQDLKRTNLELRSKVTELESATQAQKAVWEAKFRNLKEHYNSECLDKVQTEKKCRQLERTILEQTVEIEHEKQARQSLQLDKDKVNRKFEGLKQSYSELEDSYRKVLKEKRNMGKRLAQIPNQKFKDEDGAKASSWHKRNAVSCEIM